MLFLAMLAAAAADIPETKAQSEQHTAEMQARMDADHDGYVTFEELRSSPLGWASRKLPAAAVQIADRVARAEFDKSDADHDGRLSLAEALAAADRNFVEADTDHDGLLTLGERTAFSMRKMEGMQSEIAGMHLVCQHGAACETMRHN